MAQTPKEKAKDLVHRMLNSQSHTYELYDAKLCTLIAVDEIIHNNNEINGHGDGWMYVEENTDYWEQVKEEINKL